MSSIIIERDDGKVNSQNNVEPGRVGTAYQKLSNRGEFCMKDWIETHFPKRML